MPRVLGLKFTDYGQIYYFASGGLEVAQGDRVVVKTDQGLGLGQVVVLADTLPAGFDLNDPDGTGEAWHDGSDAELNKPARPVRKVSSSKDSDSKDADGQDADAKAPDKVSGETTASGEAKLKAPSGEAESATADGQAESDGAMASVPETAAPAVEVEPKPAPEIPGEEAPAEAADETLGDAPDSAVIPDGGEAGGGASDATAPAEAEPAGETPAEEQPTPAVASEAAPEAEIPADDPVSQLKTVLREANEEDLGKLAENEALADEAFRFCRERIESRKLAMKLVDVEIFFDRGKIIFYFTAPTRIDFRELVKDLVKNYRTRIELRQIGVRHETQMVGAVGNCGMVCCCRRFLRKFVPVTIKMAKEQNLFLNPTKISGICGRLLCCLSYEQSHYEQFHRQCPKIGKRFVTTIGHVKVIRANIFRNSLSLFTENHEEREVTIDEWHALEPRRPDPEELQALQQAQQREPQRPPRGGRRPVPRPASSGPAPLDPASDNGKDGDVAGTKAEDGGQQRSDKPRSDKPRSRRPKGQGRDDKQRSRRSKGSGRDGRPPRGKSGGKPGDRQGGRSGGKPDGDGGASASQGGDSGRSGSRSGGPKPDGEAIFLGKPGKGPKGGRKPKSDQAKSDQSRSDQGNKDQAKQDKAKQDKSGDGKPKGKGRSRRRKRRPGGPKPKQGGGE